MSATRLTWGLSSFYPHDVSLPTPSTHVPPKQLIAGDSIDFLVQVPGEYTTWTGGARITGPATLDCTSCATEGSDFHVYFQGTNGTSGLLTGQYMLTVWASSGNDRKTIAQFPLSVFEDVATGTPELAHAMTMLALVEKAIRARIAGTPDGGIEKYAIEGTSVEKLTMLDLEKLRNKYSAEVGRLQNPNAPIPRIKFTFVQSGTNPDYRKRLQ